MLEKFRTKIVFSKQEDASAQLLRVFEYILNLQPETLHAQDKDEIYGKQQTGD